MGVDADPSYWHARPVLVTGAAGLLGGWTCRALREVGANVVGLDNDWSRPSAFPDAADIARVHGDVRDTRTVEDVLRRDDIDTVIHLAAQTLVMPANADPTDTFDNNIRGTWVVLEACRLYGRAKSIVVASSDKAYGDHGGQPYVEDMALRANHPYAVSKTCTDVIAQTYAVSYGLPIVITRCGNMYGGGDIEWSRVVPGTIRSVLAGQRPVIRSDGRFVREYLYVEDAARGVLALARAVALRPEVAGGAFNFGSDTRLSVLGIVNAILGALDSQLEPDIQNNAVNEIRDQRVAWEKARSTLGWHPTFSLEEGLTRAIAWYRTYLRTAA